MFVQLLDRVSPARRPVFPVCRALHMDWSVLSREAFSASLTGKQVSGAVRALRPGEGSKGGATGCWLSGGPKITL